MNHEQLLHDIDPSPASVSLSESYNLLGQISQDPNRTFQHEIQCNGEKGRLVRIRVVHRPGFLGIAIPNPKRPLELVAYRMEDEDYQIFLKLKSELLKDRASILSLAERKPAVYDGLTGPDVEVTVLRTAFGRCVFEGNKTSDAGAMALDYIGWSEAN